MDAATNNQWFLLNNGQVRGPMNRDMIENEVAKTSNSLIWGRGMQEWQSLDKWRKFLEQSQSLKQPTQERLWRVKIGDKDLEPMNYESMVQALQGQTDFSQTWVWTEGYSEWREVYQIHRLMDDLGVGRRAHPRVPIVGQIQCEATSGIFVAQALSISEGGMGMTQSPLVKIGEKIKITLKSPNLYGPLIASCEVVYVGNDGYVGMRFTGLQTESKSAIIEYVKKFTDAKPG